MIVAGVDPGTVKAGLCVVEPEGTKVRTLYLNVIKSSKRKPKSERIAEIFITLLAVLRQLRPDVVVIEKAFIGKDPRAALAIGEARGMAIVAAGQVGATVVEYTATEARRAILAKGNADKAEVQRMVERFLWLPARPPPDAADAAAMAIAYATLSPSVHELAKRKDLEYDHQAVDDEIRESKRRPR